MGFRGTFKGTLKENFDRILNPRKFLNEVDESNINEAIEPLDPDDQDVKDMNIGNFPVTIMTENLKKIKDPTRACSSDIILEEDQSAVAASDPYEKTEPLILNTTFPNMQWKFVKIDPNNVNLSMIVSGRELGKGAPYELDQLKEKSFYGDLVKWMRNESSEVSADEIVENNMINELGTGDGDGDPVFDRTARDSQSDWPSEDDSEKPTKGDSVYLKTQYPDIASRIMYIDSTHVFWKTDNKDSIDVGSKGTVYHIGQLRDKELYDDLLKWMDTGDKTELENKLYTDI